MILILDLIYFIDLSNTTGLHLVIGDQNKVNCVFRPSLHRNVSVNICANSLLSLFQSTDINSG